MTFTATPSSEIVRHANREMLRYAIARQITCLTTNALLDLRDAVAFTAPGAQTYVVTGAVWDAAEANFHATYPGAEVIDGRTL